jgi:RNA polymerase sigma-70 factor (ECF subfamily)
VTALVDLVHAAQNGDRDSFAALYAAYARMVHGILLARVPRTDVEDLVQDVFLSAMQQLHTVRRPEAFGGWLAALARNRATDHLRRVGTNVLEAIDDAPPSAQTTHRVARTQAAACVAAVDERSEALHVLAIIRTLPDAYRETLVLRLVEGMTGPEIAERTGLTAASVRVNLHRGFKLLRQRLGVSV